MTHAPSLADGEVIRVPRNAGFVFDRQAKGSHETGYNPGTRRRVTVPNHPARPIARGTLMAIVRESGLTVEELLAPR